MMYVVTFDSGAAAADIAAALVPLGTPERAVREKRYLKSDLEFLGVSVPDTRRLVTAAARRHPTLDRAAAVSWALALWREPVHEHRMAAVEVLRRYERVLEPSDLRTIEGLVRSAAGWALVDPLAGDVAGCVVLRHPRGWFYVDKWTLDADFWVRRSALLSLLPGIRVGQPDMARFDRYAVPMLGEREFFIRKAIGWVAREMSLRDPDWVAAWTGRHLAAMSGVTFREAVRRLPDPLAAPLRAARPGGGGATRPPVKGVARPPVKGVAVTSTPT
jgi:3-methyladenine DNA glycosylase AlkD